MLVWVWGGIVVIGVLHYGTSPEHGWVHDVLRRLYYLPIIVAAFQLGLRGGLAAAIVVSVTYLPHAFMHPVHHDPARGLEKALEIMLYLVVGTVAGYLASAARRRQLALQAALDEQQRLTRQLVRAGRLSALGEVVAGIAHEIKNPLHALAGTAEVVDPLIPPEAEERRMWDLHVAEIARLRRIADRFLTFAKPRPLELGPVDLRDVAHRVVDLVGAQARKHDVRLEVVPRDHHAIVEGDLDGLAQVVMNIVINGIAALEGRGGLIRMSIDAAGGEPSRVYSLHIENDGPPIAEDMLEHIFDPFRSGDDRSTGLGLSIASRIAEQHGGYIEASNAGLGVRFSVFIPALHERSTSA
jgi:signal transduction histidine kinase